MQYIDLRKEYGFLNAFEQNKAAYAVIGIYDEVMDVLYERFNVLGHGSNHSKRYWELFSGKWIFEMITQLYVQCTMGKHCNDDVASIKQAGIKFKSNPKDLRNIIFTRGYSGFLKQEITSIWREYKTRQEITCDISSYDEIQLEEYVVRGKKRYENRKKSRACYPKNEKAMYSSNFKYLMSTLAYMKFDKLCNINHISSNVDVCNLPQLAYSVNKRKEIFRTTNDFTWMIFLSITFFEKYYPKEYLEGYEFLKREMENIYQAKDIRNFYVIDNTCCDDILFDIYIAHQIEKQNARLFCFQHGGAYGMLHCIGLYEYITSDEFVTFGWNSESNLTISNLLLLRNPLKKRYSKGTNNVLLISTYEPEIRFSIIGMISFYGYRESIVDFLNNISGCKDINIEWRSYNSRYSGGESQQVNFVKNNLINKERILIDVPGSVYERQHYANLVVLDHVMTTMLETIGNDVPTILYWDPEQYNITDEWADVLNELERVGIYHKSAEQAAEYIKFIISDIETWWNQPERVAARNMFKKHFSCSNGDIISDYVSFFLGEKYRYRYISAYCMGYKYFKATIHQWLIECSYDNKVLSHMNKILRSGKNWIRQLL